MTSSDSEDLQQEIASLKALVLKLGEVGRRVSQHLDVDTLLQEVIDNARNLAEARYGALFTYERSGSIRDFITSGLSPEDVKRVGNPPRGLGILGYLNEMRDPLRLSDVASHPRFFGFPENHPPMRTFMGMPIHHLGEHVGNICLSEKEGSREFTGEDEEVLGMFAAQAGAAISNARKYRREQQARADLEALLNISPVGVLVFDGKTGDLV